MAPEQFKENPQYDYRIDLWMLGCTMYEMVVGYPPFEGSNKAEEMRNKILLEDVRMPSYFSKNFKSLLDGLLAKNPRFRLTLEKVKSHAFFKGYDWEKVFNLEYKPPINPKVSRATDLS